MDHTLIFARHFARLVWLLLHEPANTDEQKVTLRALVAVSKDGAVSLAPRGEQLHTNVAPVPSTLPGVADVFTQMTSHGLAMIMVDASAAPADVLGVARILAGMPTLGDGGAAAEAKRLALGATTVRFAARPGSSNHNGALPDMEFGEVFDDPLAEALKRATPRSTKAITALADAHTDAAHGGLFAQFAAPRPAAVSHDQLIKQLDGAMDAGTIAKLLDDFVALAESAAREGKAAQVSDIVLGLVRQMSTGAHAADRRVFFDALVRLKAGVPTLIQMLGDAQWQVARIAADLLGEMQAREAEGPLTALLGHSDDRVRRSASSALMRLGTPKAMQAIQEALTNPSPQLRMEAATALAARKEVRSAATLLKALDVEKDEDVQASFLVALGKLGTPDAVQRLLRAAEAERSLFRKKPSALRIAAVHGLTEARTPEAMEGLRGLMEDREVVVREAAVYSMGKLRKNGLTG